MNALGKRLTALEGIAESARRRELRDLIRSLPEAYDLTPAEVEESVTEALRLSKQYNTWQRAGLSEREIYRRLADE